MVTLVVSPCGIPATTAHMEGFGVNTYKWSTTRATTHAGQVPLAAQAGRQDLTAAEAAEIQAQRRRHATKDLYDAIERGDLPEWEFCVQIMSDDEHPELDFDPLDDTKRWPEDKFPLLPVGRDGAEPQRRITSSRRASRSRSAPACSSTASTSRTTRCCIGRTLSYSDTQRYRVGPNYLQLPVNAAEERRGRAPTSATARWPIASTAAGREPARQLRAELDGRLA